MKRHPLRSFGNPLAAAAVVAQLLCLLLGASFLFVLCHVAMWVGLTLPFLYDRCRCRDRATDEVLVWQQLGDLLQTGAPLPEALRALSRSWSRSWSTRFSPTALGLAEISDQIERGATLAEGVARSGRFSPVWPALLRTAEELDRLPDLLVDSEAFESIVPVVSPWTGGFAVLTALLACTIGLFVTVYILPTFVTLAEGGQFGSSSPVLAATGARTALKLGAGLALVAFLLLLGVVLDFEGTVLRLQRFGLSLPPLRTLLLQRQQSRLLRLLAAGLRLGLPTERALALVAPVCTDPSLRAACAAGHSVTLAELFEAHPTLFDPTLVWLCRHSENLGNLPESLAAAAEHYTDEAAVSQARLGAWAEGAMVAGVGTLVGVLVIGFYVPVVGMIGSMLDWLVVP